MTGHDHGDDGDVPPGDAILIEVCTSCRGTLGSRLAMHLSGHGMNLKPGPERGIFAVLICVACAVDLAAEGAFDAGGAFDGLVLVAGDPNWLACQHAAARHAAGLDAALARIDKPEPPDE